MADAADYRQSADATRNAQRDQKKQTGRIVSDYFLKDNAENLKAIFITALITNYVAPFTGTWTFNDVGELFQDVPGYFTKITGQFR